MNMARSFGTTAAVVAVLSVSLTQLAPAITADVAKKCRELAVKAHPPALAGSRSGTAQAERDYFRACVAKGGKVENDDTKK
jgi:hypothetical protein